MRYDLIKDRFEAAIKLFPAIRKLFFRLLDLLLLRQRYVKKYLIKYCAAIPALRYYDAGAGFCQYSWFVLNRWKRSTVFASDLKAGYLESFANFLKPGTASRFGFKAADLQTFAPQRSFDLVTAIDILEHIEDDLATLKNFHACLAPGGFLVISTPSDTDEAARFTAEHVRPGYNKAELEAKLRSTGFKIVESLHSYGNYGSLSWRLLIKTPLRLIGTSKALALLLPFYYLVAFPLGELLMRLDLKTTNKTGTGLIVVARKPV